MIFAGRAYFMPTIKNPVTCANRLNILKINALLTPKSTSLFAGARRKPQRSAKILSPALVKLPVRLAGCTRVLSATATVTASSAVMPRLSFRSQPSHSGSLSQPQTPLKVASFESFLLQYPDRSLAKKIVEIIKEGSDIGAGSIVSSSRLTLYPQEFIQMHF